MVQQLVTFLNGEESRFNVYELAALLKPDVIDAALLGAERLNKKLLCSFPDEDHREDIIKRIITNKDIQIEGRVSRMEMMKICANGKMTEMTEK